jgi:hypothetical protein
MNLDYAKIMQYRMVKSGSIISGGYLLIGIVIRENCEVNEIKTGEFKLYFTLTSQLNNLFSA